jgi:hypothetical protein
MNLRKNEALKLRIETVDRSEYLFTETGGFPTKFDSQWKSPWFIMKSIPKNIQCFTRFAACLLACWHTLHAGQPPASFPKTLLIGDSISMAYHKTVVRELVGLEQEGPTLRGHRGRRNPPLPRNQHPPR